MGYLSVHGVSSSAYELVTALRQGGYVIVMRHARSSFTSAACAHLNSDNFKQERQLDDAGRTSARLFGEALRRLRIPIGQVLSSPTSRALETVQVAALGEPAILEQLGDCDPNKQADPCAARAAWLREKAAEPPGARVNIILVTHLPNIMEAFASEAEGLRDGEALIIRPDGQGGACVVARVRIDEWPQLAAP